MLLKKLEVHYIILKSKEFVLIDIYSNQNNNLKLIYIKNSFKIYIYSKFDFY